MARLQTGVMDAALVIALGLVAGALTTLAGLGGGLMLLLALSLLWEPSRALAVTAPALLAGNLHRLVMLRSHVDRGKALAFAVGALPGALVGGLVAAAVPALVIRTLMIAMTALAIARAALRLRFTVPRSVLVPAGAGIGALTGAAGGAGLLVAPLLLSAGLIGEVYVATGAACAVVMHGGRIIGYGAAGLIDGAVLFDAGVATLAIVAGNTLGLHLRTFAARLPKGTLEYGVMGVAVLLALVGVA